MSVGGHTGHDIQPNSTHFFYGHSAVEATKFSMLPN